METGLVQRYALLFNPLYNCLNACFSFQRRKFLQLKRRKYGYIYKTHLFGTPTVRVQGAENVRQILLGEHKLVSVHWPASVRTILGSGCLSNLHDSQHKHMKKVRIMVCAPADAFYVRKDACKSRSDGRSVIFMM